MVDKEPEGMVKPLLLRPFDISILLDHILDENGGNPLKRIDFGVTMITSNTYNANSPVPG